MTSELLGALGAICESGRGSDAALDEGLGQVLQALEGLGELRPATPEPPAVVTRYLGDCRAEANHPPSERLLAALERTPGVIAWRSSRSYDNEPSMADFLSHYAVGMILGPDRFGTGCPFDSEQAALGLTLQGPNLDYPAHAHEAMEIYYILSGEAEWQQGDGVWRRKGPGDFMLHGAHEPHAMRSGDRPLLSLFAWFDDLMSDVYLVA